MNNPNPTITAMNNEYYDLQYIKAIPIADYLHACGIEPAKRYNGYALYHAPYREDLNASMKVDFRQNLWHDYGTGQGGSIIDLVMLLQGCDAHKAMSHLAGNNLSFHSATPPKEKSLHCPRAQGTFSASARGCPHTCNAICRRNARLTFHLPNPICVPYAMRWEEELTPP